MGVFHVFLKCANGTKSCNASLLCVTRTALNAVSDLRAFSHSKNIKFVCFFRGGHLPNLRIMPFLYILHACPAFLKYTLRRATVYNYCVQTCTQLQCS